ncbi:OLC1v1012395C2 [Oldenlandia corymbosa var. corymbosa]|nr:OLC1v1012395C2 [Oldenlandia corymbosa var. corymbosa]
MTATEVASEDATAENFSYEEFFDREEIFAIAVDSPNGEHTLEGCSNLPSPSISASISTSDHHLTGLDSEVHFLKADAVPSIIITEVESEDGRVTKSASLEDEILSNSIDEKCDNISHVPIQRISVPGFQDIGEMLVTLTDEEEVIRRQLMRGSSRRDIVSIVGMPGIGKTTLAKKVYSDPEVAHHFHRRAWCSVSQVYGKRELLLDIIKDIQGLPDEMYQMTDADLELKLFQKLKKIRYLIVMDDVWDVQAFYDLERSFPDDAVGSRILITSRFHNVALEARPGSEPHMLRPLSDDESWNLLEKKSFPTGGCPEELEEVGKEIARQCKGLPLAVVAVAGILRRTQDTDNHWIKIAESLSSRINADPETRCKAILELSYMHLPSHLKACFLYLGAFSEDKDVPVSKLIRLWIAEGFIECNEATSLEAIAEDYLMDLINGSLVMISKRRSNGKVKACCIHGLLRDLCLSKAQEDNFLQLISRNDEPYASYDVYDYGSDFYDFYPSDPVTYECQRVCIYLKRKHFIHSRPSGPSTSSLIFSAFSDSYPRRPYSVTFICHHFKLLRVLDLECINMGSFFPSEIELLAQLRYLAVSGDMESIPGSISNLRLLKTLIVKGLVGKITLPDSIWRMASLRHLHINSYAVFSLPDDQTDSSLLLDNLFSLSVLSLCHVKDAEKILRRMPQLHKLICIFRESWNSSMNCNEFPALDFLTRLESLDIFYFGRDLNPGEFTFPLNLKKLTLSHFRLPWHRTSSIGRLPNLEVLKLCYGAFVGEMWEMTEDEFTKLMFLKFDTLNIAQWDASYEHLPVLQHLVIHNCKNLEEVPFDFYGIPTLQMIEVQSCKHSVEASVRKIAEETEGIKVIIS